LIKFHLGIFMSSEFDREKTRKKIGLVLENIKSKADPRLLAEYRKLFKQEVSFFRRSWAAAYLLMLYDGDERSRRSAAGPERRAPSRRKSAGFSGQAEEVKQARPVEPLPEEEARQLFINIGRSRRVFPREILGLIYSKASVSREDIGSIRILDNYSFVQVRDTVADTIIEALDGKNFRGRILTVNYARSRRDDDEGGDRESRAEEDGAFKASSFEDEADETEETAEDIRGGASAGEAGSETGGLEDAADYSEQEDDYPDEKGV
jgi:hypothetical protein